MSIVGTDHSQLAQLTISMIQQVRQHYIFRSSLAIVVIESNYGGWVNSHHLWAQIRHVPDTFGLYCAPRDAHRKGAQSGTVGFWNNSTDKRYAAILFNDLLKQGRYNFYKELVTSKDSGKLYLINQLQNLENEVPTEKEEKKHVFLNYSGKRIDVDDVAQMTLAGALHAAMLLTDPILETYCSTWRRMPPVSNALVRLRETDPHGFHYRLSK